MDKLPEISICIPAYKNTLFLSRLLDSILMQTFKNFEVVITDDSPDDSVEHFIAKYSDLLSIRYYRNSPALGTPENWNEGIRLAKGKWIKMMHDDDWFSTPDSLEEFYKVSLKNANCSFFFSAFKNIIQDSKIEEIVKCNWIDRLLMQWSSLHLFKRVYVGNPSCTFIKRDVNQFYDSRFKYVVDFEYYIRIMNTLKSFHYIDQVLVNVGFNNEQVTKYTFRIPAVQIPENLVLLEKLGGKILRNILVYDYYWRMFRNLEIQSIYQISTFYSGKLHPIISEMVNGQRKFPMFFLRKGIFSKSLMLLFYLKSLVIKLQ